MRLFELAVCSPAPGAFEPVRILYDSLPTVLQRWAFRNTDDRDGLESIESYLDAAMLERDLEEIDGVPVLLLRLRGGEAC